MLKKIMLLMLVASSNLLALTEQVKTINTDESYPYKQLIEKANEVKLKYKASDNGVECRVLITLPAGHYISQPNTVSHKRFSKKPMASCMARDEAKSLLRQL